MWLQKQNCSMAKAHDSASHKSNVITTNVVTKWNALIRKLKKGDTPGENTEY